MVHRMILSRLIFIVINDIVDDSFSIKYSLWFFNSGFIEWFDKIL